MREMTSRLTDVELVRRTLAGERSCFDVLVERYRDRTYRLIYFRTNAAEEAYDLAQDTFVAAYQSLPQLRNQDKFGPWIRRIAENICNMWKRSKKADLAEIDDLPDLSRNMECELVQLQIRQAISQLSETNRTTAEMFFLEGYSHNEIAESLALPVTTIKRRINLSRAHLRKEMNDMLYDNSGSSEAGTKFNAQVMSKIEVLRWYQDLSRYISAGMTLRRALYKLSEADYPEQIRQETLRVVRSIEQGVPLSEALTSHAPSLNIPRAAAMIRSGEVGGVLDWSLKALISWVERENLSIKLDAAYWLRTFSRLLSSGVPIVAALDTMKEISGTGPVTLSPDRIKERVMQGQRLSEAFADCPEEFSPAVIALIQAGEYSGSLETSLLHAASMILSDLHKIIGNDPGLEAFDAKSEVVEQLRVQLLRSSATVKIGSLKALEHILCHDSVSDGLSMVADDDPLVCLAAVELLERHPSGVAVQPLQKLLTHSSDRVRSAALRAISAIDSAEASDAATRMITDDSRDVRITVLQVAGRSGRSETAKILINGFEDKDCLVVNTAVTEMSKLGEPSVTAIMDAIYASRSVDIQAALSVLSKLDQMKAREVAIWLLERGREEDRPAAIDVVAEVADASDSDILMSALSDENLLTLCRAATGLRKMKSADAVPALMKILNHASEDVQIKAAQALGTIGDISAANALAAKLSVENPRSVVTAALDALAELDAVEYASIAADMILEFARKGYNVGMGVVQLIGQSEVNRLVEALSDPQNSVVGSAANYLAWIVRKRDNGKEMLRSAGAGKVLKRMSKTNDAPWVRQMLQLLES